MAENKGNPYHDEEGKFTSKDGVNSKIESESTDFDIDNIDSFLDSFDFEEEASITDYKEFDNVLDAQNFANKLLGKDVIFYDESKLAMANDFNKALFDIKADFPKAIDTITFMTNRADKIKEYTKNVLEEAYTNFVLEEINKNSYLASLPNDNFLKKATIDKYVNLIKKKNNFTSKSYWYNVKHSHGIEVSNSMCGGVTNSLTNAIALNPYNTEEEINDRFSNTIKGEENKNGIKWTCYHELGHIVSNSLLKVIDGEEKQRIVKIFRKARDEYHTTYYGRTSYQEFISEAFSDCYLHGEKARSFHKEIFKVVKQLYNKYNGVE